MSVILDLQSDYVQPSQACVNPLFAASSKEPQQPASKKPRGAAKVSVDSGIFSGFDAVQSTTEEDLLGLGGGVILKKPKKTQGLIRESGDRKTARVTLNDCLACSGCVTSAETVLIESQSVEKFKSKTIERIQSSLYDFFHMALNEGRIMKLLFFIGELFFPFIFFFSFFC